MSTQDSEDKSGADAAAKSNDPTPEPPPQPWWKEIVQPFIDLVHAPRALMGVNVTYFLEGLVYFGMLGYLVMYFNQYVGLDDKWAGPMVGVLTSGITLSMFFFGGLADRWGIRIALIASLCLMLVGRVLLAGGPTIGLPPNGLLSAIHIVAMGGILFIILGYGMYQPAAYAAVKQLTTPKTAAMGYAMLYALMNLGGYLPSYFSPIRKAIGISGTYWVFSGLTVVGILATSLILTRRVVDSTIAEIKAQNEGKPAEDAAEGAAGKIAPKEPSAPKEAVPWYGAIGRWIKNHPLADAKFSFFIFALIPVQTLFAHNWLTLPTYVERAYRPAAGADYEQALHAAWSAAHYSEALRLWIGANFEFAVNFNPILIFILVPVVAAITQKRNVYNMMIAGTLVMASPTFLLALGPSFWTLLAYLVLMTIGEAMWQPRFLQYAAEIAPEGRTGAYMGVAQLPWFLTKALTSLYSGWFLSRYVPEQGDVHSETMWLIYGIIAVSSSLMLIAAKSWVGKDFKTKA